MAALDRVSDIALREIDMNSAERRGDPYMHHHVGVLDNIPIHPLPSNTLNDVTTLGEAADTALRIAAMLTSKDIPTLLYGEADRERGRTLVQVRKSTAFFQRGQTHEHTTKHKGARVGGEAEGHPTMGLSLVGAVPYVLSYNLVLSTDKIDQIKGLLAQVRDKENGVQALAYSNIHEGREVVEIACNLTKPNSERGCPEAVLGRVSKLARKVGLEVVHSYSTNPLYSNLLDLYLKQEPVTIIR